MTILTAMFTLSLFENTRTMGGKRGERFNLTNLLILNQEEKRAQERRRNLLHLVAAFLGEQG